MNTLATHLACAPPSIWPEIGIYAMLMIGGYVMGRKS